MPACVEHVLGGLDTYVLGARRLTEALADYQLSPATHSSSGMPST
jgi:hypothetical protein